MAQPPSTSSQPAQGQLVAWLATFGVAASFVWGVAEATLFFFVPDVIVGAVALFVPRLWWRAALAAVAGSVLGGVLLYAAVQVAPGAVPAIVAAVPGIPAEMVEKARAALATDGGLAMVTAPLAGIPYKVYVTEMSVQSWGALSMVLWSIPARAPRILLVGLGSAVAGHLLRRQILRWPVRFLGLYAAGWTVFYIGYFAVNGF